MNNCLIFKFYSPWCPWETEILVRQKGDAGQKQLNKRLRNLNLSGKEQQEFLTCYVFWFGPLRRPVNNDHPNKTPSTQTVVLESPPKEARTLRETADSKTNLEMKGAKAIFKKKLKDVHYQISRPTSMLQCRMDVRWDKIREEYSAQERIHTVTVLYWWQRQHCSERRRILSTHGTTPNGEPQGRNEISTSNITADKEINFTWIAS